MFKFVAKPEPFLTITELTDLLISKVIFSVGETFNKEVCGDDLPFKSNDKNLVFHVLNTTQINTTTVKKYYQCDLQYFLPL